MSFGRQLPRQILEEIMLVPGYVFAVLDAEPLAAKRNRRRSTGRS